MLEPRRERGGAGLPRLRVLALAVRLVRPRGRAEIAAAAVAATSAAALVVALGTFGGVMHGLGLRQQRLAARQPALALAPGAPLALQQVHAYAGEQVVVLYLTPPAPPEPTPAPALRLPGVRRLPQPGEVVLSPAAARLRAASPAIAALTPGRPIGAVATEGLRERREIYAVVGVARAGLEGMPGAHPVSGFGDTSTSFGDITPAGRATATLVGFVVLGGCLLVLARAVGGQTGRARRRRLAAFALLGAPPRLVASLDGLVVAVAALIGGVLGALALPGAQAGLVAALDVPVAPPTLAPGAGWRAAIVALVVAVFALATTRRAADPWSVRLDVPARRPALVRVVPLALGVLGLAAARWHERSLPPGHAVGGAALTLLVGGTAACVVGVGMAAPCLVAAAARALRVRAGVARRCGAARAGHDPGASAGIGAALGGVVVVGCVALAALQAAVQPARQASEGPVASVVVDVQAVDAGQRKAVGDLLGTPLLPAVVVMRAAPTATAVTGVETVTSGAALRADDLSWTVVPGPGGPLPAAVALAHLLRPGQLVLSAPMVLAAAAASAMAGGLGLLLVLAQALAALALGLGLLRRQADRADPDAALLVLGLPRSRLRAVQAWEVLAGAGPTAAVACLVGALAARAWVGVDDAALRLDPTPFAGLAVASGLVVAVLAGVAALATPAAADLSHRRG